MPTIQQTLVVDGVDYLDVRQIEIEFCLTRATCWRHLRKCGITHLVAYDRYFYPAAPMREYLRDLSNH